jgi:hypothetical protein
MQKAGFGGKDGEKTESGKIVCLEYYVDNFILYVH